MAKQHSRKTRRSAYLRAHWKLGVHLILQTRFFGVNNEWFSPTPSPYGKSYLQILRNILLVVPLIQNYRLMKWRMSPAMGFISKENFNLLFEEKSE